MQRCGDDPSSRRRPWRACDWCARRAARGRPRPGLARNALASHGRASRPRCSVSAKAGREREGVEGMSVLSNLVSGISQGTIEVIDLTAPLSDKTPILQLPDPFANTISFALEEISHYDERGPAWYWNNIHTGEHTGTHFDAPIHWVTGKDQDDVSQVRNVDDSGSHTPGFSVECAKWLAEEAPIIGVGTETVGTDAGGAHAFDPPFPCHTFMLGAGKYGLTQLQNLAMLPPQGAVVIASPLPIVGGSGSPARALALVER